MVEANSTYQANPKRKNIRGKAMEILCRWEERGVGVEEAMDQPFIPDQRDRQLLHSLIFGVIRWRGYFDWLITRNSSHPLAKMKCLTRQALRVGLAQLLFLERIPAAAAINETVMALKAARQPPWLTGFVNGLLREIDRRRTEIPTPWGNHSEKLPLAARLSHPDWLIDRWRARYGLEKTMAICAANNLLPVLCLRVNTRMISVAGFMETCRQAGLITQQGVFSSTAVRISDYRGPITAIPGYAEGWFQVQDEAAQLVSHLLVSAGKGNYLDACAGLGGKATHLAELLPADSRLTAVEPQRNRIDKLHANLERLDAGKRVTVVAGELASLRTSEPFKGILVDAPCSGLGVIRRHPDIRWNRSPEELSRYQAKQLALLEQAASLLAPGGVLVYATCSIEPEENEWVVESFCRNHAEFSVTDCRDFLPPAAAMLVDRQGHLRTLPGEHELDGFFAARIIKEQRHS
jgi:16S rRNA (cytosine967-C5)-methyltransferase